jgi:hypothetical protein
VTDPILSRAYADRALWIPNKQALTAFLTINVLVFLVPMMPKVLARAVASVPTGTLSPTFHEREGREALISMSNMLPLAIEMPLRAFRLAIIRKSRNGRCTDAWRIRSLDWNVPFLQALRRQFTTFIGPVSCRHLKLIRNGQMKAAM